MVTGRIGICLFQFALLTKYYTVFLCLAFVPVSTQDDKSTCSIPSVKRFQDTVLTCHFPEDLSVTKKDFTVYHYVEQGTPESVLDCWWIRGSQECYPKPGFTFDKRVSRSLNLTVDRVDDKHVGKYACQIAGYGSRFFETCEFMFKLDTHNTCKISKENDSLVTLTCFFNEDINKTQKNFYVYKHNEQEKLIVVYCLWENGNPRCRGEKGYQYEIKFSTYFNMAIPMATNKKTYNYSCWIGGSHGDQVKTCSLAIDGVQPERKKGVDTVALGASLGVLVLTATAIAGLVVFVRKRRRNRFPSVTQEEEIPMMSPENQHEKVTEEFQAFLLHNINDMYPNLLNECYFVPPVYFNKTRYSQKSVANEVYYVPNPPDQKDLRHDRAMQHVIHYLRHMAEQYQEQMFVLTQFSYDDYLRCPSPEYTGHHLPVPGGLEGGTHDQDIGCFDVLIIHRYYGVVVGVVKTVRDKDDGREDWEQRKDELLISEMSEGLRQLQRAESMIQHLMSDMSLIPVVRRALMFPNITKSTLRRAFYRTSKGKDDKTMETTIELCLCADHLSHPSRPWDVDSNVMTVFREWWQGLRSSASHGPAMSDDVYQDMIARFCGPATVSAFEIDDVKYSPLPKTLSEAVMLTGELFERLTLSLDMANLLQEPRVCLAGPHGTGKSKTLALVGKTWISEGHTVHVINTCAERSDAITQLYNLLLQYSTGHSPDTHVKSVIRMFCNIDSSREIDDTIRSLISEKKGKTYCALIDEPDEDKEKLKNLQEFLQKLNERLPDNRVWVAISRHNFNPPGWTVEPLKIPFTCPPSVMRKACQKTHEALFSTNSNLLPTDGLPVKFICHTGQDHAEKEPRDCEACGNQIVRFFTRDLRVVNQDTQNTEYLQPTSLQTAGGQSPSIQWKDVLFLFEIKVTEDSPMIQLLKDSGIPVQVINSGETRNVQMTNVKDNKHIVLAENVDFSCFQKKKVVVYVEGAKKRSYSAKWSKQLSFRCTSQLIVVRIP
ncbi:uncharacterized protein LOC112575165 isoform X2 [Pomacea canaliculata]|uniref:uncharacterized protein LOC112575165 isoform X2 n=1 Tax=Pomacea canaliculata TaxID=400727 RepID=UPI000D73B67B|nr:uncharacterized protein LOC112575165 isoform X2 [Pomacea canaliculata]